MRRMLVASCIILVLAVFASAQQAGSSSNTSVSSSTAVSADKSGANVQSDNKVDTSSQTSVATPGEKSKSVDAGSNVAAGTTINAVLAKPLDSRKCKPGDEVIAKAAEDVRADGKVVIKKGSKLVGRVTQVESKSEGHANSSLGVLFDHAVLKDGQQVQINSVIQAIAAGQAAVPSPMADESMATMGSSAATTSSARAQGGGLLGGVGSTVNSTTGAVANVGGNASGVVNSAAGTTANVGNGVQGTLNSTSNGVVGLKGLSLTSDASNATQGSVITSTGKSVHLDGGTQLVLRVVQ